MFLWRMVILLWMTSIWDATVWFLFFPHFPLFQSWRSFWGEKTPMIKTKKHINKILTGFSGEFCLCVFLPHREWRRTEKKDTHTQTNFHHSPSPGTIPQICLCLCAFSFPDLLQVLIDCGAWARRHLPRAACADAWETPPHIAHRESIPVYEQRRVDLATFRALPASTWGHCFQVLCFTIVWDTPEKAKVAKWSPAPASSLEGFDEIYVVYGPKKPYKTREKRQSCQIDPCLPPYRASLRGCLRDF